MEESLARNKLQLSGISFSVATGLVNQRDLQTLPNFSCLIQLALQEFEDSEERREELKQQVAVAATQLLQNPEENLANLRTLLALAADKDAQVNQVLNSTTGCRFDANPCPHKCLTQGKICNPLSIPSSLALHIFWSVQPFSTPNLSECSIKMENSDSKHEAPDRLQASLCVVCVLFSLC